jgi:3-hydroxy-9,10-secoandrosta-1,3,5(10)-triene-9,17-dione monooxygenase
MPDSGPDFEQTIADLTARAKNVAEELKSRVTQTEEMRRVPEENLARLREEGLLGVLQSRRNGGHELSMRAHLDVVSAVAEGCSASAWVLGVMQVHSWLLSHFPTAAQDDVYKDDPNAMVSAVLTPKGKAVRQSDGTYVLNGFWPFGSGCQLSNWLLLGAEVVDENDEYLDLADFLIPTSEVDIKDDWYVAGLQGTGSCSLAVKNLQIPAHRYLSLIGLLNRNTPGLASGELGWIHRGEAVPVLALALCGGAIGLGRMAIKQFRTNIEDKKVAYTEHTTTEWSSTHITYATAASTIDAGELLLYRAADEIDRLARNNEAMTIEMRGRMRMDCSHGTRMILEGADKLFLSSGGSGLSLRNPMQQISRDLHAINMHGLLMLEPSVKLYGWTLLGLEPNTIII